MEKSLEEPDYLVCSTILTQPATQPRRKPPREPQLSFAKQLMKKTEKARPMAALRPQADYAADKAVMKEHTHPKNPAVDIAELMKRPYIAQMLGQQGQQPILPKGLPGDLAARAVGLADAKGINPALGRAQAPNPAMGGAKDPHLEAMQRFADSQKEKAALLADRNRPGRRDGLALFTSDELPEPPNWLLSLVSAHLVTLPLSTEDHVILSWFQTLQDAFVRIATRYKALAAEEPKKKISNAERFRLKLPPVPPKALVRPNQPAPFILPGMDYTDEEVEAMGLQDYLKPSRYSEDEVITVKNDATTFWGRLVKVVLESNPSTIRTDVMEALWLLLDKASQPASERQARRGYGPGPAARGAPGVKAGNNPADGKAGGAKAKAPVVHMKAPGDPARRGGFKQPTNDETSLPNGKPASGEKLAMKKPDPPIAAANPDNHIKQRPFEDFIKARTEGKGSPAGVDKPLAVPRPFANLLGDAKQVKAPPVAPVVVEQPAAIAVKPAPAVAAEEVKVGADNVKEQEKQDRIAKYMKDTLKYREKQVAELKKLLEQERSRRQWLESSLEDPGTDAEEDGERVSPDEARESPLAGGADDSASHEEANAFEQHVQRANKAKALKLADQIQPDLDLIDLEKEDLAHGGEKLLANARPKQKPMMAGMAKARPAARKSAIIDHLPEGPAR